MVYYAHSQNEQGKYHLLKDHLVNTAELARDFAKKWDAGDILYFAALIHDIGKFNKKFQNYLLGKEKGYDHSTAGTIYAFKRFQPMAFLIAGHHGGMPNFAKLKSRISNKKDQKNYLEDINKFKEKFNEVNYTFDYSNENDPITIEFFLRMCYSALVDADFLDTERHFNINNSNLRYNQEYSIKQLWLKFKQNQENLINTAKTTYLNQIRKETYFHILKHVDKKPGFFSMTLPTGVGKTRTGLGFALKHALINELDRVIVVVPYTNIIEQTADVYRGILGSENVLEHHSALNLEKETEKNKLAAENWDMPVIVTTSVQFFESLYANKPSKCRKLHNLAKSVIIFDEVQTFPPNLLSPIISGLKELVKNYGSSVVFSTATQPAFKSKDNFKGIDDIFELAPNLNRLFSSLKRVTYNLNYLNSPISWKEVARLMIEEKQALAVVNTKDNARELFDELKRTPTLNVFHLSTNMCPTHRREVLKAIKSLLKRGEQCYLISTQLIEAGVDIDFPLVLRALAPLDSIVQAAGRCNREGKLSKGEVIIFRPGDEKIPQGVYQTATDKSVLFLDKPDNLHSPEIFYQYFSNLYQDVNLDKSDIQELRKGFNYQTVNKRFKIISENTVNVIIQNYNIEDFPVDLRIIEKKGFISREEWRMLQPYTVSIKKYKKDELLKEGLIYEIIDEVYVWGGKYSNETGIINNGYSSEDFIC